MIEPTRRLLWRLLAILGLVLAIIGSVLPVMPTVPFLLVAAWAAGKGWPQLEVWMLAHPTWGPHIRHWRENGAVPRKAKVLACTMMACSGILIWFMPVPVWVRYLVDGTLLTVAIWLCSRPEPTN